MHREVDKADNFKTLLIHLGVTMEGGLLKSDGKTFILKKAFFKILTENDKIFLLGVVGSRLFGKEQYLSS